MSDEMIKVSKKAMHIQYARMIIWGFVHGKENKPLSSALKCAAITKEEWDEIMEDDDMSLGANGRAGEATMYYKQQDEIKQKERENKIIKYDTLFKPQTPKQN